ncbi:unnamed protein product, partial [Callosobruchus maculatus]
MLLNFASSVCAEGWDQRQIFWFKRLAMLERTWMREPVSEIQFEGNVLSHSKVWILICSTRNEAGQNSLRIQHHGDSYEVSSPKTSCFPFSCQTISL